MWKALQTKGEKSRKKKSIITNDAHYVFTMELEGAFTMKNVY